MKRAETDNGQPSNRRIGSKRATEQSELVPTHLVTFLSGVARSQFVCSTRMSRDAGELTRQECYEMRGNGCIPGSK